MAQAYKDFGVYDKALQLFQKVNFSKKIIKFLFF